MLLELVECCHSPFVFTHDFGARAWLTALTTFYSQFPTFLDDSCWIRKIIKNMLISILPKTIHATWLQRTTRVTLSCYCVGMQASHLPSMTTRVMDAGCGSWWGAFKSVDTTSWIVMRSAWRVCPMTFIQKDNRPLFKTAWAITRLETQVIPSQPLLFTCIVLPLKLARFGWIHTTALLRVRNQTFAIIRNMDSSFRVMHE